MFGSDYCWRFEHSARIAYCKQGCKLFASEHFRLGGHHPYDPFRDCTVPSIETPQHAGPAAPNSHASNEILTAENDSLRLLLEQAGIDAQVLLAQAGIDAKERETADKLQKLILEELHHRIKNTLATVSAIASQSLRTATSLEHGQHAIEGRLVALGRAHDLLLQARWANADLANTRCDRAL
jgi:hypothetical protein